MITKREAAIISAYTGILLGSFTDLHAYINEIMKRPVFTHEMADAAIQEQIKKAAKPDFLRLHTEVEK